MEKIQTLIENIVDISKSKKYPKEFPVKDFQNFIRNFYIENQKMDFVNYSLEELHNAAFLSFSFFLKRESKNFKVRVYNPTKEKDGFESSHTFFDIVNDDMPFLVDSIVGHLNESDIAIKNIIHPIFSVSRDKNGNIQEASGKGVQNESVIQLHLDKVTSNGNLESLEKEITKILETINLVVGDWKGMIGIAKKAQDQIGNAKKLDKTSSQIAEIKDFISWIIDENFILLGAKEFDIVEVKDQEYQLEAVENSSLGIFRSPYDNLKPRVLNSSFKEVSDSVVNPYVIEILKSRYKSSIHRVSSAERIRIQKISEEGKVIGEFRFVGMFTTVAYSQNPNSIPLIKNKISKVIADSGFSEGSHNYKDLVSILESYPRDDLFQINSPDLLRIATGIVAICGRSQVRFFARKDKFNRFVSCLIYTPKERSNSKIRIKIKSYLSERYNGEVTDSFVQITESKLIRLHVIIRTDNGISDDIDESRIEHDISNMTKIWSDDLKESIQAKFPEDQQTNLYTKYKNAFSVSYVNKFDARRGAIDIARIEECLEKDSALFNLYKSSTLLPEEVSELKIYNPEKELILSEMMPILESFGFNIIQEYTYAVAPEKLNNGKGGKKVWIHYFHLNLDKSGEKLSAKIKNNFEKLISLTWNGFSNTGPLNKLIVSSDLNWKQIYILSAYTKYIYQAGFRYSQSYIADVLVKYNDITKLLVELFEVRFDPNIKVALSERKKMVSKISDKIDNELIKVSDVTNDAVIRKISNAISATLRTNYYQSCKKGGFKGYVSLKFDCEKVSDLPLPLPHAEIFVYSPKVEGVHLRGGKVARGGLRWSDRHEDFRTEVLGLMKAQMTKNAVIVPVGSKGGFLVKKPTHAMSREELQQEGVECYKTFLRGLLDLTDNVVKGKIDHPENTIMYDDSDPYLVVAADKGTATFSDIANSISEEYNFWLGDAFASGGSVGYDHKKMGITAKGAWISVQRHFREMGIDTQSEDFTCAGVGDLAGDVFGNGMLLSPHIRMVAAFNHMHIFIDPNPDSKKTYKERQRMFNLPRSSWLDYDTSLISKGGGIFERSAKSIKLSKEIQVALDIEEDELSPTDLIRAILKSKVDLIWNGGIGTYVKSTDESNQDVGDRANDDLRINGNELRCKVVGEGGNLGLTQKGRIEYALNGGRINTDAMDNSAGVDCSDQEVNIKIALTQALLSKKITLEERNSVLESMTDNVSELVLRDNILQTQAVSIAAYQGVSALGEQAQFLNNLEKSGFLNREIEFLPLKKDIDKKQIEGIGLSRPELCVMLSYAKMDIYNHILESSLVKDKYFESDLLSYFPTRMQEEFSDQIEGHQLRNEIIATQITNFAVNRAGITFINQICQDSGFAVTDVVKSLVIAYDSFRLREVWEEIESLNGKIDSATQTQMFLYSNKLLERSVLWLLRNQSKGSVSTSVTRFRKIADELFGILSEVLAKASVESFDRKVEKFCQENIDKKLATRLASMDPLASAFDIAEISAKSSFDLKSIAKIYFAVGTRFSLKWLRSKVSKLSNKNQWQRLSSKTILEDLYSYQMSIAKSIVTFNCDKNRNCEVDSLEKWIEENEFLVERLDNFISDLKENPNPDLSVFIVALNRIKPLVD